MAGGGTTARGFLIFLGATFLSLLWDVGELVRLQWYVQSEVSIVSNWGTHFTSCGSKNPLLQGFSHPLTHVGASWAWMKPSPPYRIPQGVASPGEGVSELQLFGEPVRGGMFSSTPMMPPHES